MRGDIYFVTLNLTRDHEHQGMPPVLIKSLDAFDLAMGTPLSRRSSTVAASYSREAYDL
ncbi:type II toxin-antitoxin system PemK/MazF family toxin [Chromohalobacter sp. 48-RD10]|uniref:type II toxin-antitoxin system PemK/MazF family toxin n=1 Tax=Chromohalobacter sp. 48-RD10 TaxID=2994063 RepID=UPI002468A2A8|nr:type II toxin-antitoxin system PemK/MazF family toxin [Chromohalobacter sp. 48-RD10]